MLLQWRATWVYVNFINKLILTGNIYCGVIIINLTKTVILICFVTFLILPHYFKSFGFDFNFLMS